MQQMQQQEQLKDLEDGDDSSSNSDDGIKTGKIPVLSRLRAINWKKIAIIAGIIIIIVIIIVLMIKASKRNDGKYIEGDLSNVPYVVSSMVMDKLVIVYDASNNYTYAFQNKDGEYVNLEESISEAIETLNQNESTALTYLDEDSNKSEQIKVLKKMIQAEIATQYPDLTLNEDLGLSATGSKASAVAYTGSSNDYCVDMSSSNALPACSEAQLKQIVDSSGMGEQGKANMSSVVGDLVKYQEQYGVNAVFFMAACATESGWGNGWDLIDPSTYNWMSVKGTRNGGYIDRNGTSWNKYNSFSDAAEAFFELITNNAQDGYYFGQGKYTVQTIAPTYCNPQWGNTVAGFVEQFYGSIGITPNLSTAPTASGGQASASSTSSNSSSSTTNKTSGNQTFLQKAADVKRKVADEGYTYGHSDPRNGKLINCASFTAWSLLEAGYNPTENGGVLINGATRLMHWCADNGFQQVYAGQTLSVEEAGLQPGDLVTEGATGGSEDSITHVQIYAGKDSSGNNIWYNCGGDTSIAAQPGEDHGDPYGPDHYILWAYRVPGGSTASSSPSNVTDTTGDQKIDEKIDQKKTVKGGIKVQRKDTDGSTKDLKYTSTKNFNALISQNDPRALEYYTLVKTSGSSNSSNSASNSGGVALEGSEVSEQIWNFLVKDMGYSEVVAAGILGNAMQESGGNTLNIDPTVSNSAGYYGVFQWSPDTAGVVGKDLAGQLQYFKDEWISTFDSYAKNYKAGFSYEEFKKMTDVEQATIAFATIMERYEGRVNGVWQSYAVTGSTALYEQRIENAKNAYATYAGTVASTSNATTSGTTSANVSDTVSATGGNFVDVATKCHAFLRENKYVYGQARDLPVKKGDCGYIDCSAYVSMALEQFGFKDWSGYPHQLTTNTLITYGESKLQIIAQNVSISNTSQLKAAGAQAGDIVVMDDHTQILYGYDSSGKAIWLNCGTDESILVNEGTDAYDNFSAIHYIFRVPGSSTSGSVVSSLDNFLFIGDSRYAGIESQLRDLGDNVTAIGVGSSTPAEWVPVIKNGSGYVDAGSFGKDVTLPETVSGVSVMLGVNNVNGTTQISDMQEVLNALHERYPAAPIMVNSVYHLGPAYGSGTDSMNTGVDTFNQAMKDFCNQNTWAYYVDVTQNLDDGSGYLKSEYSGDGLHISSTEGITTLVDNIKNGILSSGAVSSAETLESGTGRAGYAIVVANRKDVYTTVTDSYEYASSYTVEKANGHTGSASKTTATPASQVINSTAKTEYSSQNADYQAALQNFTLYFDFLWAILVDSNDTKLVSKWAGLVSENVADKSKVILTVYSDENTSTSSTTQSKGTVARTNGSDGPVVSYDNYNVTETTDVKTVALESKPCITSADTWLVNYENEAEDYSEYQSKTKEKINEKVDAKSNEDNIIKILRKSDGMLESLISDEDLVDEMIEENEKVSFMIDVYGYVLDIADGKKPENLKFKLDTVMDTNLFDLSKTESETSQKVLLYDSLKISDAELELLYKAVEKICSPFGDNDDNTNRKKLVTSVILNRAMSSKFPNSVGGVLNQKHQFENMDSISKNDNITVSDSTKQAVDTVIVGGDCAQRSVYFAKPSTAKNNKWDDKYKFTFNDGDESDNSFNYYTTEEIESELAKYETTISGNVTKASLSAQKIIKWANSQVGKSEFENKHDSTTMSSNNSSPQFVKSAYFEGGMDYISGDIPCPNEIKKRDDGTIDWTDIPDAAVIVSNSGIVSLYVGNGYVIEAGGDTIQKVTIDESQSGKDAKGWGFAATDQDDARDKLVVTVGGGGVYPEGITEGTNFTGWNSTSGDGVMMIYTANNHSYKVYCQGSGSYSSTPYWDGTVKSDGCGITSTSIILTGYGVDANPDTVIKDGLCPNGNDYGFYVKELEKYGIKSHIIYSGSKEEILSALKAGRPVIANVKGGIPIGNKGYKGHYVTLLGMDASGQIFLGDPGSTDNSGYYDQSKIFTGAIVGAIIIDN